MEVISLWTNKNFYLKNLIQIGTRRLLVISSSFGRTWAYALERISFFCTKSILLAESAEFDSNQTSVEVREINKEMWCQLPFMFLFSFWLKFVDFKIFSYIDPFSFISHLYCSIGITIICLHTIVLICMRLYSLHMRYPYDLFRALTF